MQSYEKKRSVKMRVGALSEPTKLLQEMPHTCSLWFNMTPLRFVYLQDSKVGC